MVYQDVIQCMSINNYTGAIATWSCTNTQVPILAPLMLFVLFSITMLGSYFSSIRTKGYGDIVASFCIASLFIGIVAVVMYLANPPIIDSITTFICIVLAIIGLAAIFSSTER